MLQHVGGDDRVEAGVGERQPLQLGDGRPEAGGHGTPGHLEAGRQAVDAHHHGARLGQALGQQPATAAGVEHQAVPWPVQRCPSAEMAMCTRVCSPSEPPYAMRYPPGTRTTQGDSTPNSSLSPMRPGSTATPTCCHGEPTGCTASMIRPVVPSWPEYHMRSVPSRSSRTQGRLARTLSGLPEDPGGKTSPSRVHSTVRSPSACLALSPCGCLHKRNETDSFRLSLS